MKSAFLSVLALSLSLPAFAEKPRMEVTLDCAPVKPLDAPFPVKFDQLLALKRVYVSHKQFLNADGSVRSEHTIDISSTVFESLNRRQLEITERYSPTEHKDLLVPFENKLHTMSYEAVVLSVLKYDIPFSPGPVPPGTYPSTAVLTLVSQHGDGMSGKKVSTLQVDLDCKYTISYGRWF